MRKLHLFITLLSITIPCIAEDCLKETAPEYDIWVFWNKPDCWCCRWQCRGDTNCSLFLGKIITLSDLTLFKTCFNVPDYLLTQECICADLNHDGFLGRRVTLSDLNIFKHYFFDQFQLPCCDLDGDCILTEEDKYNFWTD